MRIEELGQAPNLMSLFRVALAPVAVALLARPGRTAMLACAAVMVLAGITDALDGWMARRRGQVSDLGIALDPIADKLFAAALVIGLILYREFPIWLAAAILSRDLLILAVGMLLLRGRRVNLPSNLTGKYAFAAIAVLLASYVIRYPFGIHLSTWITIALLILSTVGYARVFLDVRAGRPVQPFDDRPLYRRLRIAAVMVVAAVYLGVLFLGR